MENVGKTALLHVDIQNDFCPGGALAMRDGDNVVEPANRLTALALKQGWPIVFSRDWHNPHSLHFEKWPVHCVRETPGARFYPTLVIPNEAIILSKGLLFDGYSPFGHDVQFELPAPFTVFGRKATNVFLESFFTSNDIRRVIIDGLAIDYCVRAAVLDSLKKGFVTYLVMDACRAVNLNPDDEKKALIEMEKAGAHFTTVKEIMKSVSPLASVPPIMKYCGELEEK